jgi:hypothetical protein
MVHLGDEGLVELCSVRLEIVLTVMVVCIARTTGS